MYCSLPGSSVHGILQARVLEWVAVPFSRGSSWPSDQTRVSYVSCITGGSISIWVTRETLTRVPSHISPVSSIFLKTFSRNYLEDTTSPFERLFWFPPFTRTSPTLLATVCPLHQCHSPALTISTGPDPLSMFSQHLRHAYPFMPLSKFSLPSKMLFFMELSCWPHQFIQFRSLRMLWQTPQKSHFHEHL